MLVDYQAYHDVARTAPGRRLIKELSAELAKLDIVSRKMTGQALEQNTVRRSFISDFLRRFDAEEKFGDSPWKE